VKPSKCLWGTAEANMIGHLIRCGEGVAADPKKIEDIAAMKRPHNRQTLQSFLGSCIYVARFIKDFAELSAPLYDILKTIKTPEAKITEEMWTSRHQCAFMTIKAALASSPALAFPDFSAPMIILSDCSKYQLGGVLLQLDNKGRERVIAYTSKRLNETQQSYGVCSKESLGVQHCIRKWRSYIQGHPTICITDHKALRSLNTRAEFDTERLSRMAAEIMEYDLQFVHRPGRCLDIGDLMSRAQFEPKPEEREKMTLELAAWRKQLEDQDVLPPCEWKRHPKADAMIGENPYELEPPGQRHRQARH